MNKNRLLRLSDALTPFGSEVEDVFKSVETELETVASKLRENLEVKTLEEVNAQFKKLKKSFEPLIAAFKELQSSLSERDQKLLGALQEKLMALQGEFVQAQGVSEAELEAKSVDISNLRTSIEEVSSRKPADYAPLIAATEQRLKTIIFGLSKEIKDKSDIEKIQEDFKALKGNLEILKRDMPRGGAAHLQINVNSSVMSKKYTDINYVSNTAITWSAADDVVNKRVNITASLILGGSGGGTTLQVNGVPNAVQTLLNLAQGTNMTITDNGNGTVTFDASGGAGSGITRTSSIITGDTNASAAPGIDRVFVATNSLNLTLPDAAGNLNLYTLKNASESSVLVTAVGGDKIDGSGSVLVLVNNQALDFISDGQNYRII